MTAPKVDAIAIQEPQNAHSRSRQIEAVFVRATDAIAAPFSLWRRMIAKNFYSHSDAGKRGPMADNELADRQRAHRIALAALDLAAMLGRPIPPERTPTLPEFIAEFYEYLRPAELRNPFIMHISDDVRRN